MMKHSAVLMCVALLFAPGRQPESGSQRCSGGSRTAIGRNPRPRALGTRSAHEEYAVHQLLS